MYSFAQLDIQQKILFNVNSKSKNKLNYNIFK